MGIIKKQSIQGTIFAYIGVILGFITTGILFPKVLSTEEVGLTKVLVSISVLFSQFAGLGFNSVTIRNFPFFRDSAKGHHGFLRMALLVNVVGLVLVLAVFFILLPQIVETNTQKSALLVDYIYFVIPLIVFTVFFNILDSYYRALYNAVAGVFYKEIFQRVLILISVILYYFALIEFRQLMILYVTALCFPAVMITLSIIRKGEFKLGRDKGFITKQMAKQMFSVALFGIVTSYTGVLILNIDIVMINEMLGLSETGIYTIAFYFGTLVLIPARSVIKIAAPLIADGWKENNLKKIDDIYYKSNITLSTIGILLFMGLLINLDNIFVFLPNYSSGRYVIIFIGMANLIDMFTSVAQTIINNSKQYKMLAWLMLTFIALLIITNLIFIPKFGITGAAFASLLSKFIYNLLSYLYVYRKYKLQPFDYKYILLILSGAVSFGIAYLVPHQEWFLWDILIRSSVLCVIFGLSVYFLNISDDITQTVNSILLKIGIKRK